MQFLKCIIVFFCTMHAVCLLAPAQPKVVDSLKQLLQNTTADSSRIILQYKIAGALAGYDMAASGKYLEAGHSLALAANDHRYTAYYFLLRGNLLFDMDKYEEALKYYDSAMVVYTRLIREEKNAAEKENYINSKTDCLIGKGLSSAKVYQYQESIKYYLEAIAVLESLNNSKKNTYLATLYADIASDYYELEQFADALKFDKLGLLYLDSNKSIERYVIGNLFVADDFGALLHFDSSSRYLETVRPIVLQLN